MNWCDVIDASNYSDFKEVAESKILELKKNHITLKLTPIAWGKHINFYASSEDVSVKGRVRIKQKIISVQFYEYSIKGKKAALDKHYQQQGSFPKDAGVIVNKLFMAVEKIMELLEKKVTSSSKENKMNQVISAMLTSQGVDHEVVGGEIIVGAKISTDNALMLLSHKPGSTLLSITKEDITSSIEAIGQLLRQHEGTDSNIDKLLKSSKSQLSRILKTCKRGKDAQPIIMAHIVIWKDIINVIKDSEYDDGSWKEELETYKKKTNKLIKYFESKTVGAVKYSNSKAKEKAKKPVKITPQVEDDGKDDEEWEAEKKAVKEITALVEKHMRDLGKAIRALPSYKKADKLDVRLEVYQIIEDSIEESGF